VKETLGQILHKARHLATRCFDSFLGEKEPKSAMIMSNPIRVSLLVSFFLSYAEKACGEREIATSWSVYFVRDD
jgi:hypothetical protein